MSSDLSSLEQGREVILEVVRTLPDSFGVYRMLGDDEKTLYVGKAKSLKKRVFSYTQVERLPNRLKRMVSETRTMEIVTTQSEVEALLLEANLIKTLQPTYNILLKDGKSYPYILLTQDHPFSRLVKHRGPQTTPGSYFGPFMSTIAVDEALEMLQKIFKIRTCTDGFFAQRRRPCLQYHIKRCSGPCVDKITASAYAVDVHLASDFLRGKSYDIQDVLKKEMQAYSDAFAYEKAAEVRDKLALLAQMLSTQRVINADVPDADVIGIVEKNQTFCVQIFSFRQGHNYGTESFIFKNLNEMSIKEILSSTITQLYTRRQPPPLLLLNDLPDDAQTLTQALGVQLIAPKKGPKAGLVDHACTNARDALARHFQAAQTHQDALQELQKLFHLPRTPQRIECYDNSHTQGTNPYGVMVVADQGGLNKKAYRKFSIQSTKVGDDYMMMREVMVRRFLRHGESGWEKPDVLLIDGGQGQMAAVQSVLDMYGVDDLAVIGIAKGPDRKNDRLFYKDHEPVTLPPASSLLHFLQRVRDEAHRFAIGTHRSARQRSMTKSALDDIKNIGPTRKKRLLAHFGSVKSISGASLSDLEMVPGINKATAAEVYRFFHDQ